MLLLWEYWDPTRFNVDTSDLKSVLESVGKVGEGRRDTLINRLRHFSFLRSAAGVGPSWQAGSVSWKNFFLSRVFFLLPAKEKPDLNSWCREGK